MKNTKFDTVARVPKIPKNWETDKIDTPKTHIHDRSLSWLDTTHMYMIAHFHCLVQHTYTWLLTFIVWYNTHIHDCSLSLLGTIHIYMIAHFHGLVQHTYTWLLTFMAWYNTNIHDCSLSWLGPIHIYMIAHCHGLVQYTYTWSLTVMAWSNTHIHDRSLSWDNSIRNSGVKLILWAQASPLNEMIQPCKYFPHVYNYYR
jgi:hypothetical protein